MRRQRGFALLVVLLTMGFLALLGTQLIAAGRTDTRLADNLKRQAILEAAAEGAIVHATFAVGVAHDAGFTPGPLAHEVRIGAVPVLLLISNETDRINLNTCSLALLQAFIAELGVPPAQAAHLAAAVLDWRTSGGLARPNGAKAAQYQAAGLTYGPPNAPFQSVEELRHVLGMTPALYARMAPHLTVLTDSDPDQSTADPVVAQALTDAAGGSADAAAASGGVMDPVLRITATAIGTGGTRYTVTEVTTTALHNAESRMRVLLRERCVRASDSNPAAPCF
ncbi:MAG TPA: type II secretion system protein GspK [Rhodopila sp.]|nr:type II secretion system protein GspK [Rhodopila sp.]